MLLTKTGLTKNAESNAIICEKLLTKSIMILTILNTLREYKNTLAMKKHEFHQNKINELENTCSDPQQFWKTLENSSGDLDCNESKQCPKQNEWLQHFKTLHSQHKLNETQKKILLDLENYEKNKTKHKELDVPITEDKFYLVTSSPRDPMRLPSAYQCFLYAISNQSSY